MNLEQELPDHKRLIPTGICWCGCGGCTQQSDPLFVLGTTGLPRLGAINIELAWPRSCIITGSGLAARIRGKSYAVGARQEARFDEPTGGR